MSFKKIQFLGILIAMWHLGKTTAVQKWTSIKVKNNYCNPHPDQEAYLNMPLTTEELCHLDFVIVQLEKSFCYPLVMYCPRDDPSLCLLYDGKGYVSGIQISYPVADLINIDQNKYNFSNPNFLKTNYFGVEYYSFRTYFTNPEELTEDGRNNTSEVAEGLWAELDGEMVRFDKRCQQNSPVMGEFDMQGCFPKIGQIFARKFNERTKCKDVFFVYLFYEEGSLIGFGHGIPGIASPGPRYDVYNRPSGAPLLELLPNAPLCFYDFIPDGFTVVNVYFTNDPWNIRCPKCYCLQ